MRACERVGRRTTPYRSWRPSVCTRERSTFCFSSCCCCYSFLGQYHLCQAISELLSFAIIAHVALCEDCATQLDGQACSICRRPSTSAGAMDSGRTIGIRTFCAAPASPVSHTHIHGSGISIRRAQVRALSSCSSPPARGRLSRRSRGQSGSPRPP